MANTSGTEGFETLTSAFLMGIKMHFIVIFFVFGMHCFVLSMIMDLKSYDSKVLINWYKAKFMASFPKDRTTTFPLPNGTLYKEKAKTIVNNNALAAKVGVIQQRASMIFLTTSFIWILYPGFLFVLAKRARRQMADEFIRGSQFIEPREFQKLTKHIRDKKNDLPFGEIQMPFSSEIRHTLVVGRPGTGKTVAFSNIIERVIERDEKAIIYDFKGEYLSLFFREGKDIILNPLDVRSAGWCIFDEIKNETDISAFVASLIPEKPKSDPFWCDAPRGVLTGILNYCLYKGTTTNADLWKLLNASARELSKYLLEIHSPGLRFIEDPSSKQTGSVLSVLMQHTYFFSYLVRLQGDFCLTDWVNDPERNGIIYITSSSVSHSLLSPLNTLFVDIVGMRLLSLHNDLQRRLFFFIDELGTLQKMNMLIQGLTLSRSKGGAFFLAIQDIGQIEAKYGKELRQSIVNACGNSIIFAVEDSDTAEFCSLKLGDVEKTIKTKTLSMGVSNFKDGVSVNPQRRKDRLMMPSQIKELPDLKGIVNISSSGSLKKTIVQKLLGSVGIEPSIEPLLLHPVISSFKYRNRPTVTSHLVQHESLEIDAHINAMKDIEGESNEPEEFDEPLIAALQ
jgi:type IV secretory pathway TraG/TraD family ATPase VirD4